MAIIIIFYLFVIFYTSWCMAIIRLLFRVKILLYYGMNGTKNTTSCYHYSYTCSKVIED